MESLYPSLLASVTILALIQASGRQDASQRQIRRCLIFVALGCCLQVFLYFVSPDVDLGPWLVAATALSLCVAGLAFAAPTWPGIGRALLTALLTAAVQSHIARAATLLHLHAVRHTVLVAALAVLLLEVFTNTVTERLLALGACTLPAIYRTLDTPTASLLVLPTTPSWIDVSNTLWITLGATIATDWVAAKWRPSTDGKASGRNQPV